MRYKKENHPGAPVRQGSVEDAVTEPSPEEELACDLEPPMPPSRTLSWGFASQQVCPAQTVEVEPAE